MLRRVLLLLAVATLAVNVAEGGVWPFHHKKKNNNPLANLNSKQPDKVLFDRGMDAMNHNKFDVARLSFQTLINTYPDSEYVARAKLGIGDAWYKEGGTTSLAQAEIEYKDFITFFPNMPEAAEAQLKVANIHYRQMEKPDRDPTQALRAEEEYRQLILQFPDSKLVPVAEQRLREVQEVLAQREYDVGQFYFIRESWPAAIARLKSVADTYPLFSKADDALYLLGNCYEREIDNLRRARITESLKGRIISDYTNRAASAYDRIITRYPEMSRAEDARRRLRALGRPLPVPTAAEIAQNKAEKTSRSETGHFGRIMGNFRHAPDVAEAAKVGQPTLTDPEPTSAVQVVRDAQADLLGANSAGGSTVAVQTVSPADATTSQPVPRSPQPPEASNPAGSTGDNSIPELAPLPAGESSGQPVAAAGTASPGAPANGAGPQTGAAGASPAASGGPAATPPPAQVNDAASGTDPAAAAAAQPANGHSGKAAKETSSSKKKKKKGLRRLIPF